MNTIVSANFQSLSRVWLFVPVFLIFGVTIWLYTSGNMSVEGYVEAQKPLFYELNEKLSQHPAWQYNITQLGDAFIALSLLSIFLLFAPKVWEALLSASIISLLFSKGLKEIFDIPRPATVLDHESFTIIGKTLVGYSSMPSGHSITIFTALSVLAFAFTPKELSKKLLYYPTLLAMGLIFALSRVGVGAHYPLDVLIGSSLGMLSAILGVFFSRKYRIWKWLSSNKIHPYLLIIFSVSVCIIGYKYWFEPLPIFFLPILSLSLSIYILIRKLRK